MSLSVVDGEIRAKPIKGTRSSDTHDEELFQSGKDRAEHVMIVDLLRNDLSKVSRPGSVVVDPLFGAIKLAYATHIESTIRATVESTHNTLDVMRALMPGGSITGAPSTAMELIRHLEARQRGLDTGSIGLFLGHALTARLKTRGQRVGERTSPIGDASGDHALPDQFWNILIRTLSCPRTQPASIGVGGGIVVDSDAIDELDETRVKAQSWEI